MMPRVHQDDFSRRKDDPVEHQDENAPRMICMCDQDDFPEIIPVKVCNTGVYGIQMASPTVRRLLAMAVALAMAMAMTTAMAGT